MSGMEGLDPRSYEPYVKFAEHAESIIRFCHLTHLSLSMTSAIVDNAEQNLDLPTESAVLNSGSPSLSPAIDLKRASYCSADVRVVPGGTRKVVSWVSVAEYSERSGIDSTTVLKRALNSELGTTEIDPESGGKLLIWPPERQSADRGKLPELGKSAFTVAVEVTQTHSVSIGYDPHQSGNAQDQFVEAAQSYGKVGKTTESARSYLESASIVLLWTTFEDFLRTVVVELLRESPGKLRQFTKRSISYSDLLDYSLDLQSVSKLTDEILQREVDLMRAGGHGVHGLINFLKTGFRLLHDPYESWFLLHGERKSTSYNGLLAAKETRNKIVHEGVDQSVSADLFLEFSLLVRSIAFSLVSSVPRDPEIR